MLLEFEESEFLVLSRGEDACAAQQEHTCSKPHAAHSGYIRGRPTNCG